MTGRWGESSRASLRVLGCLTVVSEGAYLAYFHVSGSMRLGTRVFGWLPLGSWTAGSSTQLVAWYAGIMAVAFLAYGLLLRDLSIHESTRARIIMVFVAALGFGVTLIFVPTTLSTDLFDAIGHGRVLAIHGQDPFSTPAASVVQDPFTHAMGSALVSPRTGPAWVSISALLTRLTPGSFLGTVLLFKFFFLLMHLLNGLLIHAIVACRERGSEGRIGPLRSAAVYLWNPLVLTQSLASGHEEVVAMFWLLLGLFLLQRGEALMAIAGATMTALVAYPLAPAGLCLAVHHLRGRRWRYVLPFVVVVLVVILLGFGPYWIRSGGAGLFAPAGSGAYEGGLLAMVQRCLSFMAGGGEGSWVPGVMWFVDWFAVLGLAAWYLSKLRAGMSGLGETVETMARYVLYYLFFATSFLAPAQIVWLLGLVAVTTAVDLRRVAILFSASVLLLEMPDLAGAIGPAPAEVPLTAGIFLSGVAVGVPLLYLLAHRGSRSRGRRDEVAGKGRATA